MKNLLITLLCLFCLGKAFSQNPPCSAGIGTGGFENGLTTLFEYYSYVSGSSASYNWSNGATTPEINVTSYGTYCVTVTYDNGCVVSDCFDLNPNDCWSVINVYIYTSPPSENEYTLKVSGFPYMSSTYQWSNGLTTPSFVTTEEGTYCVTVTRENGCTSTSCRTIPVVFPPDPPNPPDPPAPACYAQITHLGYENGVTTLSANDTLLTSNNTYLWSTGATTPTIDINTEGLYCVTVTDPDGCTAIACENLTNNDCVVYINSGATPAGIAAYAVHAPSYLEATYLWSDGATTPHIIATESGDYCVTVTSENGCTAVECLTVDLINEINVYLQPADSLNGSIIADVYLIQYDPETGILSAPISAQTNANGSGHVQFSDVPLGQYLVKAAVVPGTVGFTETLPTYYGNELFWSDATYVNVPISAGTDIVIYMIPGNNPGGPGFIGGLVSEGANLTGHHTEAEFSGEGDPIAGASIILTLPDGTAVAAATTNSVGEYSFPSLPYGTYVVTINIPGVMPVSTTITLSPANPGFSGINFDVNQSGAVLGAEEAGYEAFASVSPNPATDVLLVNLKEDTGMLLLTNVHGQTVQNLNVTGHQMRLSLASLPVGTYFLTARTAKGSQSTRVVKQ